MNNTLTLAFSPCPNDTFIFYALAHNRIDCGGLKFIIELADVETLNQKAKQGIFDVSKLSFAAIAHLRKTYKLLCSGAALGRGCGPLIVAKIGADIKNLRQKTIAIPGMWTTAYLLLGLYLSEKPKATAMPFDRIMPAVAAGDFDYGVIIHEGRFTYPNYGLVSLIDLGEWWENQTSLPIPLGGIAIRKDIPLETENRIESAIRESVIYAYQHPGEPDNYIKRYAQEMEPSVIRQHIELYVNDFTINLGQEGKKAVDTLFEMAEDSGIIPRPRSFGLTRDSL